MQIIVADPTGANEAGSFEDFVLELRSELATITKDVEIRSTDIGRGADWSVVLVTIGGLFFLGKKIEENLDAWTSLARKFLAVLQRISERFGPYRLDEHGATLLAIDRILRKQPRVRTIRVFAQRRAVAANMAPCPHSLALGRGKSCCRTIWRPESSSAGSQFGHIA